MALSQRLQQKQGQGLVMTPQLQQAIKLLQMSSMELQSFVDHELENNPLLERDDNQSAAAVETQNEPNSLDQDLTGAGDDSPTSELDSSASDGRSMDVAAPSPQGLADSGWQNLRSTGQVSLDGEGQDAAALLTREATLPEHLTAQLNLHVRSPADRAIGQYLIGMVNEAGYLTGDMASICEALGATECDVSRVLDILKTFEPVGVFSSNLQECLKLQLQDRNIHDAAMDIMIQNLQLVAKRDYHQLKNLCDVTLDDILRMVTELKTLNPKPGLAFGSEPIAPVVPDVTVRPSSDGAWIVELNSESLPRLLVNNQYMAKVSSAAQKADDKLYLSTAHQHATWLVKSLDQRARTILKVAQEIVRQQDGFLIAGISQLRPITLKQVAETIGMHESTVSRVTSNKYMSTPRGLFELKFFFTHAIGPMDEEGQSKSSSSVRHRIGELIAGELPEAVLSDDDIVTALQMEGTEIARRTVAKYRESLGIQSSVQRRRMARIKG